MTGGRHPYGRAGVFLRESLAAAEMSQERLAVKAGFSVRTIGRYVSGDRPIDPADRDAIAVALGVGDPVRWVRDYSDLVDGEPVTDRSGGVAASAPEDARAPVRAWRRAPYLRAVAVVLAAAAVVGVVSVLVAAGGSSFRACTTSLGATPARLSCAHADAIRQAYWRAPSSAGVQGPDPATGNVFRQACTMRDARVTCARVEDPAMKVRFTRSAPRRLAAVRVVAGGDLPTYATPAGRRAGRTILQAEAVLVSCAAAGPRTRDGNPWWYRVAASPWNGRYWASADGFFNRPGQYEGPLGNTPLVDARIENC